MKKEKLNVHRFREHLFFIFVQLYINCSVLNVKILCKSAKTKEENPQTTIAVENCYKHENFVQLTNI